jgi:hypothetical protein
MEGIDEGDLGAVERGGGNMERFAKIVERHTLSREWERFRTHYLFEL